jgi:NDP-sugar pyrophosphorylase family protein
MKAMVLAAGLGTRLRPLTEDRPKALVELAGRTLLEITLERLRLFGVHEVIVNVHHSADKIVEYLRANRNFGMRIEISYEEHLLDTGGGLKKAAPFFLEKPGEAEEPFVLHNVDVLSSVDLTRMVEVYKERKALAILAVQERASSRQLLFDEGLALCGRRIGRDAQDEMVRHSSQIQALAFSGIHVISPRLLRMTTEEGAFSIIDVYLRLAGAGEHITAFRADQYYWRDLGKLEDLKQAELDLTQGRIS